MISISNKSKIDSSLNQTKEESNFIPINKIIDEFNLYTINNKIEILRKLCTTITYNQDYINLLLKNSFVILILDDLISKISIIDTDSENRDSIFLYSKLFFLFTHNLIVGNNESQVVHFKLLFNNHQNFDNLKLVTRLVIKENKVKKYLLSIFYNIFFTNSKNIIEVNDDHFDYFFEVLKNLNYNQNPRVTVDKDLSEINDWLHILMKTIITNENIINNDNELTICNKLINRPDNNERMLVLELIRDYVDYAKDSKMLKIEISNLIQVTKQFSANLGLLYDIIDKFQSLQFENFKDYKNNSVHSQHFKEFICYVDILSVFLVSEDSSEYRTVIQSELLKCSFDILSSLHFMLTSTDPFYDNTFKRNRLLNQVEALGVPILEQENYFYGFQTNIMKFLSNFAFKNKELKAQFIESPHLLYYFLNHLKIDKCNPFKKEWSVLFVKSICEDNSHIQDLIKQLKSHQVDPLLKDYIINKGCDNLKVGYKKEQEESLDDS